MNNLKKIFLITVLSCAFISIYAQNDSIYNLKVSVRNDSLIASFKSTYKLSKAKEIKVELYDLNFNVCGGYIGSLIHIKGQPLIESKPYTFTYTYGKDSIAEITLHASFSNYASRTVKMNFYIISGTDLKNITYSNTLRYSYTPKTALNNIFEDGQTSDAKLQFFLEKPFKTSFVSFPCTDKL